MLISTHLHARPSLSRPSPASYRVPLDKHRVHTRGLSDERDPWHHPWFAPGNMLARFSGILQCKRLRQWLPVVSTLRACLFSGQSFSACCILPGKYWETWLHPSGYRKRELGGRRLHLSLHRCLRSPCFFCCTNVTKNLTVAHGNLCIMGIRKF